MATMLMPDTQQHQVFTALYVTFFLPFQQIQTGHNSWKYAWLNAVGKLC